MPAEVFYGCDSCIKANSEYSFTNERHSLVVMPDGKWLCEGCWEDLTLEERERNHWGDLEAPPERTLAPLS